MEENSTSEPQGVDKYVVEMSPFEKQKYIISHNALYHADKEASFIRRLGEVTAERQLWIDHHRNTSPLVAATFDIAKSFRLCDAETWKLIICVLMAERSGKTNIMEETETMVDHLKSKKTSSDQ